MTLYLLDTNVISVLAPVRAYSEAERVGVEWLQQRESSCRLSVLTIMEIESGIEQLAAKGSSRKAPELRLWLERLRAVFKDRILSVDADVAACAGRLEAFALRRGRHPELADLLIAATARTHELALLTRNLRHFLPLGIAATDPFITTSGEQA